jgi:phosphoserine aminotransferase
LEEAVPAERLHNFNAGPAVLPLSVVEEVQAALPNFQNTGIGLLEMSHRSKPFQGVVDSAVERVKRVLSIPADYTVLFLQGGASLQFYMTALNLLKPGEAADYLVTGTWAKKALSDAKKVGDAKAIWDDAANNYRSVPKDSEYTVRENAVYLHYTTNNTIFGTAYHRTPAAQGKPLIADWSSSIAGTPIEASKHELIYAGAQKNLGPSGVTMVILSPWALSRVPANLPAMLDYALQAKEPSLYNTPNCFGIFVLERMFAWMEANGGLEGMIARNQEKAGMLYAELDRSAFWRPHAAADSRSWMNVTWRLPSEALEEAFVKQSKAAGMEGLKGHRSVGGIRASLYNALEPASVAVLVDFMKDFERKNG